MNRCLWLYVPRSSNFFHYTKIADYKEWIIGHLNQNRLSEKAGRIVQEAWPVVLQYLNEQINNRIAELKKAVNYGNFLSDTGEIWRAVNEGRGQTLFVRNGYYQACPDNGDTVEVLDNPGNFTMDVIGYDIIEKWLR
ncbi:MAG: hypothetical protein HC830_09120 [Bacteroidetes bacterium]|nr:hypothetical protein [Bacteroidota bacterium]